MPWDKKKLRSQTVSLSSYWLHKKQKLKATTKLPLFRPNALLS